MKTSTKAILLIRKNRYLMILVLCMAQINISNAQWDVHLGGAMNTTNGISRWGNVGIGRTDTYIPAYPLHIITTNNTGIKLVNSTGGNGNNIGIDFMLYDPGTNWDHREARISAIDHGQYNSSLAFYTKPVSASGSNSVTERMRIFHNGNVGIGTGNPLSLLHLYHSSPSIFIDASSTVNGRLDFGSGNVVHYSIKENVQGSGMYAGNYMVIGSANGAASYKKINFPPTGNVVFSNDGTFSLGTGTPFGGFAGKYLFDDQIGTTKLLVSAPSMTYPSIPSNYLFSVKGSSNFNSNSAATVPDNSIQGLNVSTTATYAWIQTETLKPLALNPVPDGNPTNSSYVAIGFIPGTYTVPLHYKLAVKGKIICEELKVKYAGQWSDYVFAKEYKLKGLKEVEQFITENKHLPDVPSEADIKENGFETGQMNATLLRKIEELTLYMIEQNRKMEETTQRLDLLEKENKALKKVR